MFHKTVVHVDCATDDLDVTVTRKRKPTNILKLEVRSSDSAVAEYTCILLYDPVLTAIFFVV